MKWDKNTIISIILVVLFLGSIIAAGVAGLMESASQKDVLPEDQNNTQELYTAQTDAKVLEIFPQITVIAKPLDFDQENIKTKIDAISGIKSTTVQFNQADENEFYVMISANIEADKKEEIMENISKLEFLESIELYQSALLEVPYTITFTNDANKEIEQAFVSKKIEGIINQTTQKEDQLSILVQAIFVGDVMTYVRGIEQQNLAEGIQMIFSELNLNIVNWQNKYLVSGITTIDNNVSSEIKTEMNYDNLMINTYFSGQLIVDNNINSKLDEIIDENESIVLDYNLSDNVTRINLDLENINLEKYNQLILDLSEIDEDLNILKEPSLEISISFDTNDINLDFMEKLAELNIQNPKVKKLADVDVSKLIIENKEYEYDQNITSTWLDYPQDINKTEELFTIQGYVSRNKIFYINLIKKE